MTTPLFHLAFPSHDLDAAHRFYIDGLDCQLGRRNEHALIFGLGPHQLVAHKIDQALTPQSTIYPRHFGLIFPQKSDYDSLLAHIIENQLPLHRDNTVRFQGTQLEHHSFFLNDPSNNLLEFKYYRYPEAILGLQTEQQIGESPSPRTPN